MEYGDGLCPSCNHLADKIAELEAAIPRWIPVAEKLPDEEVPVLVCGQPWPDQIRTALVAWEEWEGRWCWHWEIMTSHYALNDRGAYEWDDNYEFTHWMPLPKAALLPGGE